MKICQVRLYNLFVQSIWWKPKKKNWWKWEPSRVRDLGKSKKWRKLHLLRWAFQRLVAEFTHAIACSCQVGCLPHWIARFVRSDKNIFTAYFLIWVSMLPTSWQALPRKTHNLPSAMREILRLYSSSCTSETFVIIFLLYILKINI